MYNYLLALLTLPLLTLSSPLFLLRSTTALPTHPQTLNPNSTTISSLLWSHLSSCPTRHYAVITERWSLSHYPADHPTHLPHPPSTSATYLATDFSGHININHVLNTILMDCLNKGVSRVEELDTSGMTHGVMPALSDRVVSDSIVYAVLPSVDVAMEKEVYGAEMVRRAAYVERLSDVYFKEEGWTLVYVREEEVVVVGADEVDGGLDMGRGDGMQVLLGEE